MFSERSRTAPEPNRVTLALERARRTGRALLDLTASNPTQAKIPYSPETTAVLANPRAALYEPESQGLRAARDAVVALWKERGHAVSAEQVVLTASTSEAYAHSFTLLCDPGDEVLVPAPSYPLFDALAQYEGVRVRRYPLRYDGAWYLDTGELARRAPGARAVVVVNPNNPTGSFLKQGELEALCELGLPIVSDEVFSAYALSSDPSRANTALGARAAPLVLVLDGLSKLAGLPQMKVGWITVGGEPGVVDEALHRLEHIADAFLSPSTPSQLALPRWLEARATVQTAIQERLRENVGTLQRALEGSAATVYPIEGGWYAVVRLPAVLSEDEWVVGLIEDCSVVVQPGYFFDFETEAHVVLSLLTERAVFSEGVRRLAEHVDRNAARE